ADLRRTRPGRGPHPWRALHSDGVDRRRTGADGLGASTPRGRQRAHRGLRALLRFVLDVADRCDPAGPQGRGRRAGLPRTRRRDDLRDGVALVQGALHVDVGTRARRGRLRRDGAADRSASPHGGNECAVARRRGRRGRALADRAQLRPGARLRQPCSVARLRAGTPRAVAAHELGRPRPQLAELHGRLAAGSRHRRSRRGLFRVRHSRRRHRAPPAPQGGIGLTPTFPDLTDRSVAVVTIDMHRGHLDPEVATMPLAPERAKRVTDANKAFVDAARAKGVPIVHVVTQYNSIEEIASNPWWASVAGTSATRANVLNHQIPGSPGLDVMPSLVGEGDLYVRTKRRYDSFAESDLDFVLRALGAEVLLLTGVNTNSCVLATTVA